MQCNIKIITCKLNKKQETSHNKNEYIKSVIIIAYLQKKKKKNNERRDTFQNYGKHFAVRFFWACNNR